VDGFAELGCFDCDAGGGGEGCEEEGDDEDDDDDVGFTPTVLE